MPERIDRIYEILLQQNKDSAEFQKKIIEDVGIIKSDVRDTKEQATRTNGRVTKLENNFEEVKVTISGLQDNNQQKVIVAKVNKKWLAGFVAVGGSVWAFVVILFDHWLNKFFK